MVEPATAVVTAVVVDVVVDVVEPPPTVLVTVTELTVAVTLIAVVAKVVGGALVLVDSPLPEGEYVNPAEDSVVRPASPQAANTEVTAASRSREAKAALNLFKKKTK